MAYEARANSQSRSMTSDLKSQLSRARLGRVPRVSMKDRIQEERMLPEVWNPDKDAETKCKKICCFEGTSHSNRQGCLSFVRKSPRL